MEEIKNHNIYKTTKPSNLESIRELAKSQNASAVYKSNQANFRNLKQPQNARYVSNKAKKIKYNPMYNQYLLHKELP
jgi:transglutaminase/protease-like cytokinesis protein 3